MATVTWKNGITSVVLRVRIPDVTSVIGGGKTGLTSASAGLIVSTIADNEATPTNYTQAGGTLETITTLGTFATPTATKCRFKEVDATNQPGLYELQLANARWAVSGARYVDVALPPVSGLGTGPVWVRVQLTDTTSAGGVDVTSINGSAAAARKLAVSVNTIEDQGAASGTPTTTSMVTTLSQTLDDVWSYHPLVFTSGALAGVVGVVDTYNGSTKRLTFLRPLPAAPAAADTFVLL